MPTEPKSWEQRPDEGKAPYRLFELFRQSTHRDLSVISSETGKKISTLGKYQTRFSWRARAKDWDDRVTSHYDEVVLSNAEQIAVDQLAAWRLARTLAKVSLEKIIAQQTSKPSATIKEAVLLLEKATQAERLILGEVTERTEDIKVDKLDPQEAADLLALLHKSGYNSE